VTSTANVNPVVYDSQRRSIYLPVVRSALYEVFQAFDFADPSVTGSKRETTTIAPQALFMMNSQLVAEQAQALASSLLEDPALDDAGRVRRIYELCYSRPPSPEDTQRALHYVARYISAQEDRPGEKDDARVRAWHSLVRAIVASNEFVYVE